MPKAVKGVLVECDPSIKSIILQIDSQDHAYVVEDLDDQTVVIKETMVSMLKQKLKDHLEATLEKPERELSGSD